jgi:hypothetical protein
MKWLVIAIIVFSQQPTKLPSDKLASEPNSIESAQKTKDAQPSEIRVSPPAAPQSPVDAEGHESTPANSHTQESNGQTGNEDSSTQGKLMWFTGVLAIVGVLQLIVMFLTWLVYSRQAREMRRQRHEIKRQRHVMFQQWNAMREQGSLMEKQTVVLERSVAAAENSADAAKNNIELFINRERAWLRIEVAPLELYKDEILGVRYQVLHYGPTDAILTNSTASAIVTDSTDISSEWESQYPFGFGPDPQIIKPTQPPISGSIPIETRDDFSREEESAALREGQRFIHFTGFFEYRDVFGKSRVTRFRFLWSRDRFQFRDGGLRGEWKKHGEPEDNIET